MEPPSDNQTNPNRETPSGEPPPYRLLIVDDVPGIHEDIRKILCGQKRREFYEAEAELFGVSLPPSQRSFQIDSAYQGSEALELVKQSVAANQPYALAFVDIRMPPGWDGIETARRLWEADSRLQIVICSAFSDYTWDEMAHRIGSGENLIFLKKPFDPTEIQQLAHALTEKSLNSSQARQRLAEMDDLVRRRTEQLRAAIAELRTDIAKRKETETRLAAFATLGKRLNAAHSVKEAAEIIVDTADQLLGWEACSCHLYSAPEDRLYHVLTKDTIDGRRMECPVEANEEKTTPLANKAIREGGQLVLRDNPTSMRPDGVPFGDTSRPSASILYVPIRNGEHTHGVLSIQSYRMRAYDEHSLATLQALADHCGGALNRIKSEEALRQTEQQLRHAQKMEAIGLLAGGVAHDFNNILAIILGNAEFVMMDPAPMAGEMTECLTQIVDAAGRGSNLTRQLLAFSRKQRVHAEPLDLNQLINRLSKMLNRIIGEDIQLLCHYAEDAPRIHADAGMLEQVIMNLAVNSRDAMVNGGELHLSTEAVAIDESHARREREARPGLYVRLTVRDTGAGIPAEHLPRIFEPFFTTKEPGKGTGLGLATVFGIVKQHNGWLEVESKVGTGTAIHILLPAHSPEETAAQPAAPRPAVRSGSETILLVEDEYAVRRVFRLFLKEAGYQILEAGSGPEALDVWARHPGGIDVLLTDILMPGGMNGYALAEKLLGAKPGLKVIFMSGYNNIPAGEPTGTKEQYGPFIRKPCPRGEFLRLIRQYLDEPPSGQAGAAAPKM